MMIPGAFERRTTIAVASELPVTGTAATPKASDGAVPTGERLVYELEGGGAPSQRSRGRPTRLQKFWHSLRSRPQDPKAKKATTLKESVKHPTGETYAFGFRAVQDKAPSASGIYAIFTSQRWLYVGKSHDLRQSLFQCLNDPDPRWSAEHRPISFSFDTATPRIV